ncbi:hypothetical protein NEF87_002700 [Candidatus Lokiarchaeum ossiferum]|uniref:Uncharacterized protein n=1 Tax=Candidatus Lokiarchaeum ossiferum TaxID=2951803 RepID=A0ABY6HSL5_9ARCH|nr:hypothetical protein NEF87_002700 [Candidatus Lokiarchaeum sp. B-35]
MVFLPMQLSNWSMDNYKLILQLFSAGLIILLLVYVGLSSKENN